MRVDIQDERKQGASSPGAPACPSGSVTRDAQVENDDLGFLASEPPKPLKARVLVKPASTKTAAPVRIQETVREYC